MDKEIYMQSVFIKFQLPNGKEAWGKFSGISEFTPEEWEEIAENKGTEELIAPGTSILFKNPEPLGEVIVDKEQYNDIVDIIREAARREHHEELREKPGDNE